MCWPVRLIAVILSLLCRSLTLQTLAKHQTPSAKNLPYQSLLIKAHIQVTRLSGRKATFSNLIYELIKLHSFINYSKFLKSIGGSQNYNKFSLFLRLGSKRQGRSDKPFSRTFYPQGVLLVSKFDKDLKFFFPANLPVIF